MNQNARKDENFVNSLIAVSSADGKTVIQAVANPTSHRLYLNYGDTGIDYGPKNAMKDDNDVSTLLGVSEIDAETPITAYCDTNGNLLVEP